MFGNIPRELHQDRSWHSLNLGLTALKSKAHQNSKAEHIPFLSPNVLESEWARNYYSRTYTRTQATNMLSVITWVFLDSLAYHLSSMSWKTPQSPILIKLDTLVILGPERNYNKQIIPLRFRTSIFHWRLRDLWNEFDSYFSDCIIVIALLKSNVNVLILTNGWICLL